MKTLDEIVSINRNFVVPEKILVATDLADTEYLIPHAVAQARACGSALTLVHVIPQDRRSHWMPARFRISTSRK